MHTALCERHQNLELKYRVAISLQSHAWGGITEIYIALYGLSNCSTQHIIIIYMHAEVQ